MERYYAHSGSCADYSDWQLLAEHLGNVAALACKFAAQARPQDQDLVDSAKLAGWLHDLGKYRQEFQRMIRNLPVQKESTYHKQAGAAKTAKNVPVAFAIAGHHGGMPDKAALVETIRSPSGQSVADKVWAIANSAKECPGLAALPINPSSFADPLQADLFTRLVFSCLVDADWTDTGEHERKVRGEPPEVTPASLDPAASLEPVLRHIGEKSAGCENAVVRQVRAEVLADCLEAAALPPGLFALTVPTGGGKTLSALAFALRHASSHKSADGELALRRIIYVAPYLSIIDQNARVLREALGLTLDAPDLFEHHSLAEPAGDEAREETKKAAAVRRAESWEAPFIITTSVQFYESLFSNKPGRCRKLHNIARSVILLDECQTLPPELVAPTCSLLRGLVDFFGCTVVLCTATQPAFDHADMPERLEGVREITGPGRNLFARLQRVRLVWPGRTDAPLEWKSVAERMRLWGAALCIVNTRRAARDLFAELQKLGEDIFHLSTSMCPAHRLAILNEVRRRLKAKEPCYLVSTQLIEAGVDVDFPFVMRELAPLEAIVQAAGRCNREGHLNGADGTPGGVVEVFRSMEGVLPSDRWYRAGRSVLETDFLNAGHEPRIDVPTDMTEYFERLYRTGQLDAKGIQAARQRFAFAQVAADYRLIEEDGVGVVVGTWEERRQGVETLLHAVRKHPTRRNFRKLAPFQVNLRRYELDKAGGAVIKEESDLFVWYGGYDASLGLTATNADILLAV